MSVSGICEICASGEVEHSCDRCGKLVCDRHFDEEMDRCVECAAELGEKPDQVPDEEDMPDGVDTYEF